MPSDKFPTINNKPNAEILDRVSKTAEVITSSGSQTLIDFHKFLGQFFKPEEIEPLEVFQIELANKNPDVLYVFTALRDPAKQNALVSAAYGSVQEGILAIRFTLTETSYRSIGISQKADELLIKKAEEFCKEKGKELSAYICEAVEMSESYWNRQEIEEGNGMKRLYSSEDGEEVHYELPPLAWNPDGTPATDGSSEHLQVAVKGYPEKVPVLVLEKILKDWWNEWYIRPRDQFDNEEAWELHKKTVWDILETKILAPIRGVEELTLISKKERKSAEK